MAYKFPPAEVYGTLRFASDAAAGLEPTAHGSVSRRRAPRAAQELPSPVPPPLRLCSLAGRVASWSCDAGPTAGRPLISLQRQKVAALNQLSERPAMLGRLGGMIVRYGGPEGVGAVLSEKRENMVTSQLLVVWSRSYSRSAVHSVEAVDSVPSPSRSC